MIFGLLLNVIFFLTNSPQIDYQRHIKYGLPTTCDSVNQQLILKAEYTACYDQNVKSSIWISWNTKYKDYGDAPRGTRFHVEMFLPDNMKSATDKDYRNSGYDKGHIVPSEERTSSLPANYETFSYINVFPQTHVLNAGPWYDLEAEIKRFVLLNKKNEVYVVAGGIYSKGSKIIGDGVVVPDKTWKAIVFVENGKPKKPLCVIMPQESKDLSLKGNTWKLYVVSQEQLEKEIGFTLFNDL